MNITITRHMTKGWGAEEAFDAWVLAQTADDRRWRMIEMTGEPQVTIFWEECCSHPTTTYASEPPPIPSEAIAAMFGPQEEPEIPSVGELNPGYEQGRRST